MSMQTFVFQLQNALVGESQLRLFDLVASTLPPRHGDALLKMANRPTSASASAVAPAAAAPAATDGMKTEPMRTFDLLRYRTRPCELATCSLSS